MLRPGTFRDYTATQADLEESMQGLDDMPIPVNREWNGWRTAEVRLGELQDIHWLKPNGAPVPLVHGYILCTSFVNGEIPHECERTPRPHRLLVCVVKRHLEPNVYVELARRAAEQQSMPPTGNPSFEQAAEAQS